MKTIQRGILFILGMLFFTGVLAQQSIEGTWAGDLAISPDTEITVLFEFSEENGQWQAMLNSPDMGAIKDVQATSVSFDGSRLDVSVETLSGSYSGTLENGEFVGQWSQPGSEIDMSLSPYVAQVLSEEAMATLLGQWHGELVAPGITFNIVFHFERDEEGNFTGEIQNADAGPDRQQMSDISLEDGSIFFRVPAAGAEYNGTLSGEAITGTLKQSTQEMELNLEKGEYVTEIPQLDLDDADYEQLAGSWRGSLSAGGATLGIVLRFERNDEGVIVAFVDSPDQGANGLRVTAASLDNNELAVDLTVPPARYEATLDGRNMNGSWIQGGMSNELDLTKE